MPVPMVTMGASLLCTFGVAPSSLIVIPKGEPVLTEGNLQATVEDCIPIANIPPFGMCLSLANPTVAAATTAALGVLTPMPCIPVTQPWQPGEPMVQLGGLPILTATSMCICAYGGEISIAFPGATKTLG